MNPLFITILSISCIFLLFTDPDAFLATLLNGGKQGASLCCALLASHAVWLGLMKVWEDSGVSRSVSKRLFPIAKRLFKTDDEETLSAVCMNLSVNLLGISGAATSYGIQAAKLLDRSPNAEYASALFFVLNATSLQLLPTSVIAVRTALQSSAPAAIVLPSFLSSLFSTLVGVFLIRIRIPQSKGRSANRRKRVIAGMQ